MVVQGDCETWSGLNFIFILFQVSVLIWSTLLRSSSGRCWFIQWTTGINTAQLDCSETKFVGFGLEYEIGPRTISTSLSSVSPQIFSTTRA